MSHATEQVVATAPEGAAVVSPKPAGPPRRGHPWRQGLVIAGAVGVVGLGAYFLYPLTVTALNTVSTDDAYVNGHVTMVAPRVTGQVAEVLVDDNDRVRKGQPLVRLDRQPYQVQVDLRRAMVEVARANLTQARAQARAIEGTARSRRWRVQTSVESVQNQLASLGAAAAVLESRQATFARAQADYRRAENLFNRGAIAKEEMDMRREGIRVAEAQVAEAQAQAREIRVALGLPADPPPGRPLTDAPADLPETFSAVRIAVADVADALAQLGLPLSPSDTTPTRLLEDFRKQDPGGDIDKILEKLVAQAPVVKQAEANILQAGRQLDQAELDLSYCEIVSEIDGVVTRRNVNPGNNVQVGQALMAVRSVREVWVDANFKETQLADLRIGQRADLYADMYGKRVVYRGRLSGFTMGTGSTLALLPPQNATGNFVKVVQRLPVRIDLVDGNPEDEPLFIGLSIVPYVHFKEPPEGPNAGRRLQQYGEAGQSTAVRPGLNPGRTSTGGNRGSTPGRPGGGTGPGR